MPLRRTATILGGLSALVLAAAPGARPATPALTILCHLAPGQSSLPARATHGLAAHLRQYPAVGLATAHQRAAAERVLAVARAATRGFGDPAAARRAGYDTRHVADPAGGVGWLHAESRRYSADRRLFDPRRPEALIYANQPGRPLVLVGVMFSLPRGVRGTGALGPIGRWHSHLVCAAGAERGLTQGAHGCPAGTRLGQGSEMMHVWFTRDLRSAFAVHAPVPELCRDGLLAGRACRSPGSAGGM